MAQVGAERKPITVTFEKDKDGPDKVHYKESAPGGVIGRLYLSKLAIHYQWGGEAPDTVTMTIRPGF